jgi:hypothetical protein
MSDNDRRIENGRKTVAYFVKTAKAENSLQYALIDLLTDIRHYCHAQEATKCLEDAIRISEGHFNEEVLGDATSVVTRGMTTIN